MVKTNREKRLAVRVTDAEFAYLMKQAKKQKMILSTYLRKELLGNENK